MDGLLAAAGLLGGGAVFWYLIGFRSNETSCGFDAFEDARRKFDVRLIAVLFIILPRGYS